MRKAPPSKSIRIPKISFRIYSFLSTLGVLFFVLVISEVFAQKKINSGSLGFHAGINSGILSGGGGPSLSVHYTTRPYKVLQIESQLFFDSHSGETFISGHPQKNAGLGLAAGLRLNILPKKKWNPSLFLFPGLMYSSQTITTSSKNTQSGLSGAVSIGISCLYRQRHLISIGINQGSYITSAFLKYGFLLPSS